MPLWVNRMWVVGVQLRVIVSSQMVLNAAQSITYIAQDIVG